MKVNWGIVPQWILVLFAALTLILAIFTEKLPTTKRIRNVIQKENNELLKENKELLEDTEKRVQDCIEEHVKEGTEQVIVKLVVFRENPERARSTVYQDALDQAYKKKYLFFSMGCYLTEASYNEEKCRLLKRSERIIIDEHFKNNRAKDVLTLLDTLLSNNATALELLIIESYDVKVGPEKDIICHITPYDKIGIIGGYLGELKWKDVNKL